MKGKNYELKIESDISGSAASLYLKNELVDRCTGENQTGKSDYLLESISGLLLRNKIQINEIKRIVFETDNRSRTAYKIAVSILKGISLIHKTEIIYADRNDSKSL